MQEYEGDLLEAPVDAIVHQCNCMSKGVAGLARVIFERFPICNTYNKNPRPDMFGNWEIFPVEDAPFKHVINLYTQLYPGDSSVVGADSTSERLEVFRGAVEDVLEDSEFISFAFPKNIGCGLAGGNWDEYHKILEEIAATHPGAVFHIIEKEI